MENSDISKDVNSSIENQENQVNSANSNDDNSDATGNVSDTGSKEPECQTNTSKYLSLILIAQLIPSLIVSLIISLIRFRCCSQLSSKQQS